MYVYNIYTMEMKMVFLASNIAIGTNYRRTLLSA